MIYRAIVSDARDPQGHGRLKVSIPALSGSSISDWIWPVVSAGYLVTPKAGAQVWVVFENGDKETPVWLGATTTEDDYVTLLTRVQDLENWVWNHDHPTG